MRSTGRGIRVINSIFFRGDDGGFFLVCVNVMYGV
jgi:hypothetical protein